MKLLFTISRLLVGSLFIVSGLIKANDTMGFGFKLTEYFEPQVLNMPFLIPYATGLAAFICVAEVVLGIATLLGGKMKITSWSLLLLIVFFTFLTFYSAYFNKVTDCGCFGDAIKLTPWQSFYKDVVLLVFTVIIFLGRNKITYNTKNEDMLILPISLVLIAAFSFGLLDWAFPLTFSIAVFAASLTVKYLVKMPTEWIVAGVVTLMSSAFCYYTYAHLPIRDFRPYAIGKNILKGMEIPEGAAVDEYKTTLYYKKNGERRAFEITSLPDSTWDFDTTINVLVKPGYHPPIHDFSITDINGVDRTQEFLTDSSYSFMLVSYDISKVDIGIQPKINEFAQACEKNGLRFFGLSGSTPAEIDVFRHEVNAMYEYFTCDRTALKTIIRSNPGLVMLKNGTVMGMWHYNDFPTLEAVRAEHHF